MEVKGIYSLPSTVAVLIISAKTSKTATVSRQKCWRPFKATFIEKFKLIDWLESPLQLRPIEIVFFSTKIDLCSIFFYLRKNIFNNYTCDGSAPVNDRMRSPQDNRLIIEKKKKIESVGK